MSVFEPNSRYLWEVLIYWIHLKKTTTEAQRMRSSTYDEAALSETALPMVETKSQELFIRRLNKKSGDL